MAVKGAQADQFGQSHFNVWAMIKALVFNNIGILPFDGPPQSGSDGSFKGKAGPGTLVIDITTGDIYRNTSTDITFPVWISITGPVNGPYGLGVVGAAKATYLVGQDSGLIGTTLISTSPVVPAGALILGGNIQVTDGFTSGGSATIAVGLGNGSQKAALKVATAVATYALNAILPIIPLFTAATTLRAADDQPMSVTIAAADLDEGTMAINLVYLAGSN